MNKLEQYRELAEQAIRRSDEIQASGGVKLTEFYALSRAILDLLHRLEIAEKALEKCKCVYCDNAWKKAFKAGQIDGLEKAKKIITSGPYWSAQKALDTAHSKIESEIDKLKKQGE